MWDLLPVVDNREVGQECGIAGLSNNFSSVVSTRGSSISLMPCARRGSQSFLGVYVGKKLEGGYLDFDKAEITLIVGRVANDDCWYSTKAVLDHQVKRYCKAVEPEVTRFDL